MQTKVTICRNSCPHRRGWIVERKSAVDLQDCKKLWSNCVIWHHHCGNKKKKLNEDLDFITINKNLPKDGEPHQCMLGPKNHHLFKKPKVYHQCPYHAVWEIHAEDKHEKDRKMAKLGVHKEKLKGKI